MLGIENMIKLEDIKKDAQIKGIISNEIVRIITVDIVGENAVTVYYKDHAGKIAEQMFFRSDELRLSLAEEGRAWSFDASGEEFISWV